MRTSCLLFGVIVCVVGPVFTTPVDYDSKDFILHNEVLEYEVCKTAGCYESAKSIKDNMNLSVNPCDDFFSFACGGWKSKNSIPNTESHWSQFSVVDKKLNNEMRGILESEITLFDPKPVKLAKKYYKACMNTERIETRGLEPLTSLLASLGGWPMATRHWKNRGYSWQTAMTDIRTFPTALVSIAVSKDSKNSTQRVIYIDQPSLGVMRSMLLDQKTYREQVGAFKEMMRETAGLVAKALGQPSLDAGLLAAQVEEVTDFETTIAQISSPNEMRRNSFRIYNPMSLRELQAWTDTSAPNQINWLEVVGRAVSPTGVSLDWTERVVVRELDYLFRLVKLLQKTPNRVLANYLGWKLVKRFSGDLNGVSRKLAFGFEQALTGVKQIQPRWKECILSTSGALPMAVGYSYVTKYFDDSAKKVASDMSERIKVAFKEELRGVEWMDPETKAAAQDKVDSMMQLIGYPAWYHNQTHIDSLYSTMGVGDDHFANVLSSRKYAALKNLDKLRQAVNRSEWPTSPAVVNAFNFGQSNAIVFPAGILQPPFFSKERIEALNYGGIGVVIGHEIIHGFDDDGRQFDKGGNLRQWWSDVTLDTYLNKAQCFINQFSTYRIPELDEILFTQAKVNGVTTLGENIADSGGLHIALLAYRRLVEERGPEPRLPGLIQYTPEQLFFIAFATNWCESASRESLLHLVLDDPHSPHKYRVFGSLANSPDFTTAFHCNKGNLHNSVKPVCSLW